MNYQPFCLPKRTSLPVLRFQRKYWNAILLSILLLWLFASAAFAQSCPLYPSPHLRVGFNLTSEGGVQITDYDTLRLGAGWYHNYGFKQAPDHPNGILFHQMVRGANRKTPEQIQALLRSLGRVVDANPGQLWTVANEPDRHGQDGLTVQQYANFYHQVYTFIKERDPSSRIAVGGVVQPTPIRLRYLDQVLAAYQQTYGQPLPADLWHIHNFMLPENCSWGAGIPPGLNSHIGEALPCPPTLDDHGNIEIFKQQIRAFRQWMNNRGFRNYPLVISEYGILLSKYHGYDHPRVRDFMLASFDFMLNATDSQTGYPTDGNRLVQEFAWFSLNYYEFDLATYFGLNGNLFDHDSRQIMPLGLDFENYLKTITVKQIDLVMRSLSANPSQPQSNTPVALTATFANQGSVAAQEVVVRFWHGDPRAGGQLLGSAPAHAQVLPECTVASNATLLWTPNQPGVYTIFAELTAANGSLESNGNNNYTSLSLTVAPNTGTATPIVTRTPTAMPTVTPTASSTRTPSPTTTPTLQPTTTATPTPTSTGMATPGTTPTTTSTPLATSTQAPTQTPTMQPVQTTTATPTQAQTATATPSLMPTGTPTTPQTPSMTPTVMSTPTSTATPTMDATVTGTLTPLPTATLEPTISATPSATETVATTSTTTSTPTPTATATSTPTSSATPTVFSSDTPTPSAPEATVTATATLVSLQTPTATPTTIIGGNAPVVMAIDVASDIVTAGEAIRYQFRYANSSEQVVTKLTLRARIPADTKVNQAESHAGWSCSALTAAGECSFAAGDLAVGATGAVDFVLTSEENLVGARDVTLAVTVEGDQRVITTTTATVTLIGQPAFFQYLPAVQR